LFWSAVAAECLVALAAAVFLTPFVYHVSVYRVEKCAEIPPLHFVSIAFIAAALAGGALSTIRGRGFRASGLLAVSFSPLLVNIVIVARAALRIRPFYIEPLVLCVSVAAALALSLRKKRDANRFSAVEADASTGSHIPRKKDSVPPLALAALLALTAAAALWFYTVQSNSVATLSYGWRDAGLYYARVRNTALGRGFLREAPDLPSFYDHFNPGLVLLVPFHLLSRSWKMILWAQSLALAALAPAVYIYARGRKLAPWCAFLCAAAALAHPSVSQLSWSFSYGFHPITLAMPLVILSIHFWEKRRWAALAVTAVVAASFEETLFPLYAGIGLVTLIFPLRTGPAAAEEDTASRRPPGRLSGLILFVVSVALFVGITKVVMPAFAGKAYFQLAKFPHLGASLREILLSPIFRARVFWGSLVSPKSLIFTALILGGMGFLPLLAPRRLLYAAVVLVFILLLEDPRVKSIAFWYQSLVVAAWLPAAAAAVATIAARRKEAGAAVAVALLAAALLLSHFHGLLPFSRDTMPWQNPARQANPEEARELSYLAAKLPPRTRVLATMREAMLFCDTEVTTLDSWRGNTDFDVAVLDLRSQWGHKPEDVRAAFDALSESGDFELTPLGRIVVFRRHGQKQGR
jgi:uncharacterized membrane protein